MKLSSFWDFSRWYRFQKHRFLFMIFFDTCLWKHINWNQFLWIHISKLINDHLFYLFFPIIHRCIAVVILSCTNVILKWVIKKTKSLTIWTVEVTIAPLGTRRTKTIRDDVRPWAPAGLLPWNSCVVLSRQSCRKNLTWINLKKNNRINEKWQ